MIVFFFEKHDKTENEGIRGMMRVNKASVESNQATSHHGNNHHTTHILLNDCYGIFLCLLTVAN